MAELIDKTKEGMPWVEKWRPGVFNQIVSHDIILRILRNQIRQKNIPNILLYGPPGTGKTTTIHAAVKEMFGKNYQFNILELNGSNERGITVVRDKIDAFAQHNLYTNTKGIQKIVILDEADSMTNDAQITLQNVIEKYIETTRFCLICNYNTKIISALRSVCTIFNFHSIPDSLHKSHLQKITEHEKLNIEDEALTDIVSIAKGDMRQSINVLQSLSMIYGSEYITVDMLYENICQIKPSKKTEMISVLFDESNNFTSLVTYLQNLERKESLNISEIIIMIVNHVIDNEIFDDIKTATFLTRLEEIEKNIALASTVSIQMCGIASAIVDTMS